MGERNKSFFRVRWWQIPIVVFLLLLSALCIFGTYLLYEEDANSPIRVEGDYNPYGWYG